MESERQEDQRVEVPVKRTYIKRDKPKGEAKPQGGISVRPCTYIDFSIH